MTESVLITGGTGLIGTVLKKYLEENNYHVITLSRNAKGAENYLWDADKNFLDKQSLIGINHIVHLAGTGIADKPWTETRKQEIINSRIDYTHLLAKNLKQNNIEVNTIIAASAIGYYGAITTDIIFTEEDKAGTDFIANACVTWENATSSLSDYTDRLIQLRIGIVLDKNGGALKKMAQPFNFYAGAVLGTGKQFMPWIHVNDLCKIILFCIKNKNVNGVYNAVAPQYIDNNEFTHTLSKVVQKPIILPNVPAFALKLLFGEMAEIILEGSRVSSEKLINSGFQFDFKALEEALIAIYKS